MTYTYEQPSPNKSGYEPQPAPSAYFPTRGVKLNAETAIGGGPILLKDGSVRNTFIEELFDEESGVAPESYHPRTAIGVTANNKVIFFVCENRSVTEGVKGMNMAMMANVLKSLGCVDAMNLDGGGSTLYVGQRSTGDKAKCWCPTCYNYGSSFKITVERSLG
ncbi:phosphodiester glycosidase family protein [Bacteroides ovatus]|nr:phosphodiester glycosidase family protein [Bacteroides ovatus]